MDKKFEKRLQDVINECMKVNHIRPADIPNIDLYMDQVTTFMDHFLNDSKRYDEDKILTKTMINNYTKNQLLPPPNKKKYSREHLLLLIFIYYYKNMLSITDIQNILAPIIDNLFAQKDKNISLQRLYSKIIALEAAQYDSIKGDVDQKFAAAKAAFSEIETPNKDLLTMFSFAAVLSYDIYIKKHIMETLIDEFFTKDFARPAKKSSEAKQNKSPSSKSEQTQNTAKSKSTKGDVS